MQNINLVIFSYTSHIFRNDILNKFELSLIICNVSLKYEQ